jgi:MtrB/PioB family decaheme-associated outer membrane protein
MRNRLTILSAALLFASATFVGAQQTPPVQQPTAPGAAPAWSGIIDFGFRPDASSGDVARYERYRDTRDGAFTRFIFGREGDRYIFNARAENIGYEDQRYLASFNSGRAKVSFTWDQVPLNYGYNTLTPWRETAPGVLSLDSAARLAVQSRQAMGVPANAAALNTASIYRGLADEFKLHQQRDIAAFAASVSATENLGLNLSFSSTKRDGYMPWGAAFAFNNAAELPLALDNRTNDFSADVEWANRQGMLRLAWGASWFNNNVQELLWDNPVRATDFQSNTAPYYDANGYSNGNGPAQGRMSIFPSNTFNIISATGLYKFPGRSTLNGMLAFSTASQNEPLIPWTSNGLINTPLVLSSFHGLQQLPRQTAEAEIKGLNAQFNFNSRPVKNLGFSARFRYNDRDVTTPSFDATEYVRFDAVPEEPVIRQLSSGEVVVLGHSEDYDITRTNFDFTTTLNLMRYTSLRVGYGYEESEKKHRGFESLADNTFRASLDTVGNQFVMVRGMYEFTARRGNGWSLDFYEASGTQPATRLYDDAERDRGRGTLLFVVTPIDLVDFTVSFAGGKDDYNEGNQEFGLLDNTNRSVNVGVDVNPLATVTFGANYGRDKYSATQMSRNANPLSGTDRSWIDPNRDWQLDNDETVNNVTVYLNLLRAVKNTDVRLSYDYMDSDNAFVMSGARIAALAAINQFEQLPNVTNTWKRAMADISYFFHKNVGVGVGYWYEKFDVNDFATIDLPGQPGTPRIDYLGELSLGYANRPYKGSTGFLRILYVF